MSLSPAPWFVPDTTGVKDQLNQFLKRKAQMALVVDEYGEVQGLITLEDILEEIVGQIADEHDTGDSAIRPQADGSVNVDGTVAIRDLNRQMALGPARRRGDHHRRPRHPRGADDPGAGTGVHLPRLPLRDPAQEPQQDHRDPGEADGAHRRSAPPGRNRSGGRWLTQLVIRTLTMPDGFGRDRRRGHIFAEK